MRLVLYDLVEAANQLAKITSTDTNQLDASNLSQLAINALSDPYQLALTSTAMVLYVDSAATFDLDEGTTDVSD
jgi:hypothetical protein